MRMMPRFMHAADVGIVISVSTVRSVRYFELVPGINTFDTYRYNTITFKCELESIAKSKQQLQPIAPKCRKDTVSVSSKRRLGLYHHNLYLPMDCVSHFRSMR